MGADEMNETFDESDSPAATETQSTNEVVTSDDGAPRSPDAPPSSDDTPATPTEDPTLTKFKSCRWHATQDDDSTAYCSHRDVRPYAGVNGFTPEAW